VIAGIRTRFLIVNLIKSESKKEIKIQKPKGLDEKISKKNPPKKAKNKPV
jgi:hypothetical protein